MKKPTVLGFYGKSDTGKTTLIVDIIKHLTKDGFKIATVKITDKNINFDTKGKDSWKHSEAGSELTILSSPVETDFIIRSPIKIDKIINHIIEFDEFDIILIEGINDKDTPKIRIGDIKLRDNTIFTYKGDFNKLLELIKMK